LIVFPKPLLHPPLGKGRQGGVMNKKFRFLITIKREE